MLDLRIIPGLIVVAGAGGCFLLLRYLDYSIRRDRKRNIARLASLTCPTCGAAFGLQAAEAAKLAGAKRMAEMMAEAHKRGEMLRLRVVMIWLVVCPRCESRFDFRPDNGELSRKVGRGSRIA